MNLSSLMNQREFPITFTSFRCLLREIFGKKSWSSSEHSGQGYRLLYSEQFRFPNSQTPNSYKNEFLTTCVVNEVAVSKDELLKSEVDSKRRTSCYYLIPNQLTHSK